MIYALLYYIGAVVLLIMAAKEWRRQRFMRRKENNYRDYKNKFNKAEHDNHKNKAV